MEKRKGGQAKKREPTTASERGREERRQTEGQRSFLSLEGH
jgi:hypothetical protein